MSSIFWFICCKICAQHVRVVLYNYCTCMFDENTMLRDVSDFSVSSGSIAVNTMQVDVMWNKLQTEVSRLFSFSVNTVNIYSTANVATARHARVK